MVVKIFIIILLLSIFVIGFIYMVRHMTALYTRINFIHDFRNKFIDLAYVGSIGSKYYDHSRIDHTLHQWLTLNAVKAQQEIGGFGIGEFMAPFQLYKISNYEFIIQTVAKFTEGLLHTQEIAIVDNILLRWLGYQQGVIEDIEKDVKNPIKWFQYGIRVIVSLPIRAAYWFGIISESKVGAITSTNIFKVISGIIGLISFVGTIIGIVTDWGDFKTIITAVFRL